MSVWPFGEIVREVGETARQVLPNEGRRLDHEFRVAELEDRANDRITAEAVAQLDINKEEAKNPHLFVAGWRPAIGWTGALALFTLYIVNPWVQFMTSLFDNVPGALFPNPDMSDLMALILSMLGVGVMRSFDKANGTAVSIDGSRRTPAAK